MAIYNTSITTSAAELESGSGNRAITTVIVCNTATYNPASPTSGLTYLYLYAVPSGGSSSSPDTNTTIVNKLPIPAGETVTFDQEKMVLGTGDMLVGKSESPANLVVTVSTLAV